MYARIQPVLRICAARDVEIESDNRSDNAYTYYPAILDQRLRLYDWYKANGYRLDVGLIFYFKNKILDSTVKQFDTTTLVQAAKGPIGNKKHNYLFQGTDYENLTNLLF